MFIEQPELGGITYRSHQRRLSTRDIPYIQILFILAFATQTLLIGHLWSSRALPEILGDINGLVPPYGSKFVLFQKEHNFDPLNGSDPRWDILPNPGGGFVSVPNWQEHPLLPAPVRAPSDGLESYNIGVFHQLHCLHSIAEFTEELLSSETSATISGSRRKHIGHCFEYLRLALRCCGDTTFEGQGKTVESPGIDGFGSWHVCRDYDSISEWSIKHRAANGLGLPT